VKGLLRLERVQNIVLAYAKYDYFLICDVLIIETHTFYTQPGFKVGKNFRGATVSI